MKLKEVQKPKMVVMSVRVPYETRRYIKKNDISLRKLILNTVKELKE